MAYPASGSGYGEPGARRKKLAGYLKAANELRQSYFSQDGGGLGTRDPGYDSHGIEGPGAFPDAAVVRSGNEEMILFPSYARKHIKRKLAPPPTSGEISEQEYWRREWERQENDKAIVDVDVRGWIFTPQRGPANRRQRLMIGIARQMVGLPAPSAAASTKAGDPAYSSSTSSRASSPVRSSRQDEDLIDLEADNIIRIGEREERYARRGEFSEKPSVGDEGSIYDSSRNPSSERGQLNASHKRLSEISLASSADNYPASRPVPRRASWNQPANMSPAELEVANKHLLNRLKYFMANPLVNAPISAFFYNESNSRQLTISTNASGHFTLHAALDFIPTHVRVLAAEKLSVTEAVHITSSQGVSVISDIDDTIKHSGISEGARNIFRNAFIRELHDLTIDGVKEWYNTLYDMGVKFHYVSNSPWQLYPVLATFFKLAHLPQGSFHLKQYSGMLQGIFEPVAERKKASLESILRDFPDRKFILIGDSGEADLEVYTDVALDNPGKVLGILIRDVTTNARTGYFDPSNGSPSTNGKNPRSHSRNQSTDGLSMSKRLSRPEDTRHDDSDVEAAVAASLADMEEEAARARKAINPDSPSPERLPTPDTHSAKPGLPPRRQTTQNSTALPTVASPEEDLIDFSEDVKPKKQWLEPPAPMRVQRPSVDRNGAVRSKPSPSPPPKPKGLRSPSAEAMQAIDSSSNFSKPPPPRPRKPSNAVRAPSPLQNKSPEPPPPPPPPQTKSQPLQSASVMQPSPLSQVVQQSSVVKERPALPTRPSAKHGMTNPPLSSPRGTGSLMSLPPKPQISWSSGPDSLRVLSTTSTESMDDMRSSSTQTIKPALVPPPPPRRRNVTGFSTSASRRSGAFDDSTFNSAGGAGGTAGGYGGGSEGGGGRGRGSLPGSPSEAGLSKKEFLWNQRWARARSLLEPKGVTLRTWRKGEDIADVSVKLAEQELRRIEWEARRESRG